MARDKSEDARTGWKRRRASGRSRGRLTPELREINRAARQAAMTAEEVAFNPEVQTAAPAEGDFITAMSDADLAAYYQQLIGKAPHNRSKRPAIERAVRQAEADRAKAAAEAEQAGEEDAAAEGGDEDTIEGDQ